MDSHDQTHPSLLARVRDARDHAAWQEFERKYRRLILGYCRRRGPQPTDADDVCQLALLDLSRGLRSFQYDPQRGRFRHYLCRVVYHALARHFDRPNATPAALDSRVLAAVPADADAVGDAAWEEGCTAVNALQTTLGADHDRTRRAAERLQGIAAMCEGTTRPCAPDDGADPK